MSGRSPSSEGGPGRGIDPAAFALLFDDHPSALLLTDGPEFRLVDANPAACELCGRAAQAWTGLALADLLSDDQARRLGEQTQRRNGRLPTRAGIWQLRRGDGGLFYAHVSTRPLGHGQRRLWLLREMTEWLQTVQAREEALRAWHRSEADLHAAQALARLGSFEWMPAEGRLQLSPQLRRLLEGLPTEAAALRDWLVPRLAPEDHAALRALCQQVLVQGRQGRHDLCLALGDGQPRWLALLVEPETRRDGTVLRVHGTVQDVSESKQAEHELAVLSSRLRQLSADTEHRVDQERKRIAADLHDGLGQLLSSVKLRVQMLGRDPDPATLADRVAAVSELVGDALEMARDFSMHLRPPVLELGLAVALGWLVEECRLRAELACTLHVDDVQQRCAGLDEDAVQDLFRIVQESLGNVARHAGARQVAVSLRADASGLAIRIEDDGCGFDPEQARQTRHFGLFGMRERALRLGAELQVHSRPGAGCRIELCRAWPDAERRP